MSRVKRALLSVHDKTGVVEFAKGLSDLGVQILSTGGTAKLLRDSGVQVLDVAQLLLESVVILASTYLMQRSVWLRPRR